MLTPADLDRMLTEDAAQRQRRDSVALQQLRQLPEVRRFDPNEPRIPGGPHGGEWGGGSVGHALKDALKLGEKADLRPGEKLVGSDKVAGDSGTIRLALVDHHGHKSLRLGIGDETFGSRDDEAGPWRAGPDRTDVINAERKKLSDEQDALEQELNSHPTRGVRLRSRSGWPRSTRWTPPKSLQPGLPRISISRLRRTFCPRWLML